MKQGDKRRWWFISWLLLAFVAYSWIINALKIVLGEDWGLGLIMSMLIPLFLMAGGIYYVLYERVFD